MLENNVKDLLLVPSRYGSRETMERRCHELETCCREIWKKLAPGDRVLLEEYLSLLCQREEQRVMTAYNSGIQVGLQRAGKEKP